MQDWTFPRSLRNPAQLLLHQQCWCWGVDIRRHSGNLLVAYGFTRTRCPDADVGGSRYLARPAVGASLYLWGFGAVYAEVGTGAVFVGRYDATPILLSPDAPVGQWHRPTDVHGTHVPQSWDEANRRRMLFVRLCHRIADYEAWVCSYAGASYREGVLSEWRTSRNPASDPQQAWRGLSSRVDDLLRSQLWSGPAAPCQASAPPGGPSNQGPDSEARAC